MLGKNTLKLDGNLGGVNGGIGDQRKRKLLEKV